MPVAELREEIQISERVMKVIAASATMAVIIWLGLAALAFYDVVKYENGFSEVEIVEIEEPDEISGGMAQ